METVQSHENAQIKHSVLEVATIPSVEGRTARLREAHLKLQATCCLDRLRIETRVMKETEGEPMVIRRAKIFAAATREMPIEIMPDELIIGHAGTRPL